ncbi:unnamed protein product [Spirodela intermedia]|uniref:Homeobox domain-containing protein n=1 Tax=Spirodela intermedia TaxID=51605 RepID=A0A7I8J4L3_SPIIN|nr:unnamed protein product [Spirodela intermedia]CAA6664310.1 unnamed protein product [Spirodela intermedia]
MSMVANCSSDPLRIRKLRMLATAGLSSYIYHIMPQRRSHPPTNNHCLKNVADQQKHRSGSRWNPTREQLKELEEIYKRGTRTPPAHQIQLIAAELRRYGRIEGRTERQRLRRQLEADSPPENSNRQDLGAVLTPT